MLKNQVNQKMKVKVKENMVTSINMFCCFIIFKIFMQRRFKFTFKRVHILIFEQK